MSLPTCNVNQRLAAGVGEREREREREIHALEHTCECAHMDGVAAARAAVFARFFGKFRMSSSRSFAHLLPPTWRDSVVQWLKEDLPAMDIGGYVVGDKPSTAILYGKSAGVLAGSPFFQAVFEELVRVFRIAPPPPPVPPRRHVGSTLYTCAHHDECCTASRHCCVYVCPPRDVPLSGCCRKEQSSRLSARWPESLVLPASSSLGSAPR
jgi:hypothetical protein